MHIGITGGAGFIGSHLVKKLCSMGYNVTIIDNLDSYYSKQQKLDQLAQIKFAGYNYKFIEGDILNEEFCHHVSKQSSFDVVIHLAALPGVSYSLENPHRYIDMDIKATVNVLKSGGETKVKHIMFASSSSVYGNQTEGPLQEDKATGNVMSPYAASKYSAESFCQTYRNLYGFQLTILRFFTVYGPWGRPDMAIPKFIKKLLSNEPIEVYGSGLSRDFTFVDDIVNGITLALQHTRGDETYNLGYGQPVSMDSLLEHLNRRFPSMRYERKPMRTGDVMMTWSDITKAKKALGYYPKVGIEEGLDQTITWAKKYFAI